MALVQEPFRGLHPGTGKRADVTGIFGWRCKERGELELGLEGVFGFGRETRDGWNWIGRSQTD